MNGKQILAMCAVAAAMLDLNARAVPIVNFIEGTEGQPVSVQYNPNDWLPGSFRIGSAPVINAGLESASFSGGIVPPGDYGVGLLAVILLRESAGGPVSDWVTISRSQVAYAPGQVFGLFTLTFQSDSEGQTLPLPDMMGARTVIDVVETGALQSFNISYFSIPLITVGIQSDIDVKTVPDGGATLSLLGSGIVSLLGMRRFSRKV